MPRAKVPPEDRQRSTIACLPCKRAKIRCDSATPCATCSKRGREASCVYQESPGRHRTRREWQLGGSPDVSSRGNKHLTTDNDAAPTPESFDNGPASSTNDESREPQSRILLSSKLQKGELMLFQDDLLVRFLIPQPQFTSVRLHLYHTCSS